MFNFSLQCSSLVSFVFISFVKESTESEINIDCDPEIFKVLLEYAYTGYLRMTGKTVFDILEMACYMQMTDAVDTCCRTINSECRDPCEGDEISVGEMFKVSQLAEHDPKLKDLAARTETYMVDHVKELKNCEVFLENATFAFLTRFLRRG